jgi:hypothetical protein
VLEVERVSGVPQHELRPDLYPLEDAPMIQVDNIFHFFWFYEGEHFEHGSSPSFDPDSAAPSIPSVAADTAGAHTTPPVAPAGTIADPDAGYMGHGPSPALGTCVGIAATDPCQEQVAASPIDHIHEIFHYVRKLMKQPPRFVLDEAAFMAEVEEEPLFIRDGEHLRRWG